MKNAVKISLLVILLNTGFMMEAAEDLGIKVLDSQNLMVELNSGSQGNVLLLKDKFGKVLFKDSITTNSTYHKTFNLELVPNGIYYLNLDNESRIQTTVIAKTNYGLEIEKESGFVFKPIFKIKDKQVRVLLTNPEQKKTFLKVYDSYGILVGNLNSKEAVLRKTIDFSNVPSGKYRIEIGINGQNFTKEVNLE
jgi:sRNA-binding regulator protein Hfq